jgi:hypothetical protein
VVIDIFADAEEEPGIKKFFSRELEAKIEKQKKGDKEKLNIEKEKIVNNEMAKVDKHRKLTDKENTKTGKSRRTADHKQAKSEKHNKKAKEKERQKAENDNQVGPKNERQDALVNKIDKKSNARPLTSSQNPPKPNEKASTSHINSITPHIGRGFDSLMQQAELSNKLEGFSQLKGSKSRKFNGMVFVNPEGQDPLQELFSTHILEDNSCMVFEGSTNQNLSLGYIKLSWRRTAKGPAFAVGDPYLATQPDTLRKSVGRHRTTFSEYRHDKNQKFRPFFSYTFMPHPEDGRIHSRKHYTWRDIPQATPDNDILEIELREGDKKDYNGQVLAVWKMDEEFGDYVRLFYKVPSGYEDEMATKRWVTALLLTSTCVMAHGMGSVGN